MSEDIKNVKVDLELYNKIANKIKSKGWLVMPTMAKIFNKALKDWLESEELNSYEAD